MLEQDWVCVMLLVLCAAALILSVLLLVLFFRLRPQLTLLNQKIANIEKNLGEIKEQLQYLKDSQPVVSKNEDEAAVSVTEEDDTSDDLFREKVMAFIAANYMDPSYTPARLIEEMCMSRSLFHRKSTALLGQPAGRLISAYRMQKAKEMILANRAMNISDVAYAVGFNDPKYFTRYFTKFYGCSPSKITEETN